jgi:hypothetical protein
MRNGVVITMRAEPVASVSVGASSLGNLTNVTPRQMFNTFLMSLVPLGILLAGLLLHRRGKRRNDLHLSNVRQHTHDGDPLNLCTYAANVDPLDGFRCRVRVTGERKRSR